MAPYPKWIYDIAIHLDEVLTQGWAANAEHLFSLVPEGLRLVARGINDYNHLHAATEPITQVMPLAQSPLAATPPQPDHEPAPPQPETGTEHPA